MVDECKYCIESVHQDVSLTENSINDLVAYCPEFTNPIGKVARDALVSKLKCSTPGRHSELWRTGSRFVDIFFPKHPLAPYAMNITQVISSFSDSWWSNFSVAALCQSMYYQTSNLRAQLLIDKINSAVDNNNNQLKSVAFDWYMFVFSQQIHGYTFNSTILAKYLKVLNSNYWIELHKAKYSQGQWINPEWKVFHHCVKLTCLGASVNDINSWINKCVDNGLDIPNTVSANNWKNYLVWLNPNNLNHEDIDQEARQGELVAVYLSGISGPGSFMPEENSFEFTANGQPGTQYRSTGGGGCCFTKDTKILLDDDSLKDISEIRIDDFVKTRNGNSRVLFVAKTPRKNRILYSINGYPFRFTDTQPFVSFPTETNSNLPFYISPNPDRLKMFCPTLGWEGIAKLSKGSVLINGAAMKPEIIESIDIHQPESDTSDILYDLIVSPNVDGIFEYFAGCEGSLLSVVSEISSLKGATDSSLEAILTILQIVKRSLIPLRPLFQQFTSDEILGKLAFFARMTQGQMHHFFYASKQISPIGLEETPLQKAELLLIILKELPTILNHENEAELIFGCKLFELLNIHHLRELEHVFLLQWRQKPAHINVSHIAITVFLFSIDSTLETPEKVAKIILRLRNKQNKLFKRSMLPQEKDSNSFQTAFFKCLYLEMEWLGDMNAQFSIELTLYNDESEKSLYQGTLENIVLSEMYKRDNIHMFDCKKNPVGRISLDIRHLTEAAVKKEKESFINGQRTNNLKIIEPIAEAYSSYLSSMYLSLM